MMQKWVRMPSYWVRDPNKLPLTTMRWKGDDKSNNIAGLMLYIVLMQHASQEVSIDRPIIGTCSLSYEQMNDITGLSKTKISAGLKVLLELELIQKINKGKEKSVYQIVNFGTRGSWAKLPAKDLYNKEKNKIPIFHGFHLRNKNELNSLKLYLLIITFRDNNSNYALIGYDKITEYTGIPRNEIRSAISLLINLGLVQLNKESNNDSEHLNLPNMYRPCFVEPYKNAITSNVDVKDDFLG